MDSGCRTGFVVATANFHQQRDPPFCILFVGKKIVLCYLLLRKEMLRPMALLARLLRGTQVPYRRFNRERVLLEENGIDLICTGKLRFHIPIGAGADMTLSARNSCVRRVEIRRVFRLHNVMAYLTAKLY